MYDNDDVCPIQKIHGDFPACHVSLLEVYHGHPLGGDLLLAESKNNAVPDRRIVQM